MGNLPADITEDEFKRLFAKYGEPGEVFINKGKGFGFIKLVSVLFFPPFSKCFQVICFKMGRINEIRIVCIGAKPQRQTF